MGVLGHAVLGHTVLGQSDDWPTGASSVSDELGWAGRSRRYTLGDVVVLRFEIRGDAGDLADPGAVTIEVTHESGASDDMTAGLVTVETGRRQLAYAPTLTGRYVATFTATGDHAGAATVTFDVDPLTLAFVTADELRSYLGSTSATDSELLEVLRAERAAQAQRCRIDPYTYELREALLRRVARNLAARAVPVATFTSFDGGATSTRVPQVDAEVRRLEGPYRRLAVG